MKKGFTLVELIVVMGVLAVAGIILTETFFRSLSGGNKAEVISKIKQNGQVAMDIIDKTIRNADTVLCPFAVGDGVFRSTSVVMVLNRDGTYARFHLVAPTATDNGKIEQGTPSNFTPGMCEGTYVDEEMASVPITDTNTKNGVSVIRGEFSRNKKSGFKDIVTVDFEIGPGIETPQGILSAIDPVVFQTTVQLR